MAVVQYTTATGAAHNGVCSTFLKSIPVGENVYGFIRSAPNFRLPRERDVPIIMVGPGTGIAPFRAFWEHRARMKELSQATYGQMKLFFGCRYPSMQVYRREIEAMMAQGVISEYYVAYSRNAGQPKVVLWGGGFLKKVFTLTHFTHTEIRTRQHEAVLKVNLQHVDGGERTHLRLRRRLHGGGRQQDAQVDHAGEWRPGRRHGHLLAQGWWPTFSQRLLDGGDRPPLRRYHRQEGAGEAAGELHRQHRWHQRHCGAH